MCRIVQRISVLLCANLPEMIRMPRGNEMNEFKIKFFQQHAFPGVLGVIDCTHIPIQSPCSNVGEEFRNRKGYFSLNVQVVCGPDQQITDIVVRWPGSVHDSRIFNNSSIKMRFENGEFQGVMLGDQGYAQSHFMFTPIPNPEEGNGPQNRYNHAHEYTRKIIERLFGIWKRRFPCLRSKMANDLKNITNIVTACAILHNVSIFCNQPDVEVLIAPNYDAEIDDEFALAYNATGNAIRNAFILSNFT